MKGNKRVVVEKRKVDDVQLNDRQVHMLSDPQQESHCNSTHRKISVDVYNRRVKAKQVKAKTKHTSVLYGYEYKMCVREGAYTGQSNFNAASAFG